jgi:hypothetical protein
MRASIVVMRTLSVASVRGNPVSQSSTPFDIICDMRKDAKLDQEFDSSLPRFEYRVRCLGHSELLLRYAFQWRQLFSIDVLAPDANEQMDACWNELVSVILQAHLSTGANDFFLAHAVTSSFGLTSVFTKCGNTLHADAKLALLQQYWLAIASVYVVQHRKEVQAFEAPASPGSSHWNDLLQLATTRDEEVLYSLSLTSMYSL